MKPEAENLTATDSLKIISEMIEQAKGNVRKDSFYFLFWGWTVVVINLGIYGLIKFTTVQYPYGMWFLAIPAWAFTVVYGYRKEKRASTRSHFDFIRSLIWITFGITSGVLCIFITQINYQVTGVMLVVMAMPTIISGALIRFKPLMIGGTLFWVFGSLCFIVSPDTQLLLSAGGIFTGYLIPGYWLKKTE